MSILITGEQDEVWARSGWTDPEARQEWIRRMPQAETGARGPQQEVDVAKNAAVWRDADFEPLETARWWGIVGPAATTTAREWLDRGVDAGHAKQFFYWSTNDGGPGMPDLLDWAASGLDYSTEIRPAYEAGLSPADAVTAKASRNFRGIVDTLRALRQNPAEDAD